MHGSLYNHEILMLTVFYLNSVASPSASMGNLSLKFCAEAEIILTINTIVGKVKLKGYGFETISEEIRTHFLIGEV